jgi:hypothetical protein
MSPLPKLLPLWAYMGINAAQKTVTVKKKFILLFHNRQTETKTGENHRYKYLRELFPGLLAESLNIPKCVKLSLPDLGTVIVGLWNFTHKSLEVI